MAKAKFIVHSVINDSIGNHVTLYPLAIGSDENTAFFKGLPDGKIELHNTNPNVIFEVGQNYFVDFSLADDSANTSSTDNSTLPVDATDAVTTGTPPVDGIDAVTTGTPPIDATDSVTTNATPDTPPVTEEPVTA